MTLLYAAATVLVLFVVFAKIQVARFVGAHRAEGLVRLEKNAKFLGVEAAGLGQPSAQGTLLLSRMRVGFFRPFPEVELSLSLKRVESVRVSTSFLGRPGRYLFVATREPTGRRTHAFRVVDPAAWVEAFVQVEGQGVRGGEVEGPDLTKIRRDGIQV